MKIIITESKLNKVVLKWLDREFGNLTKVSNDNQIQYVDQDGDPLIKYLIHTKQIVFVDYYRIWRMVGNIFGMGFQQVQDILKIWLEETYNLKGCTPFTVAN
jgi:hypothetical protein